MALKNWPLKTYTALAWTDLVVDAGATNGTVIGSVLISNTTAGVLNAEMRVTDAAGTELAQVLPASAIAANDSAILDAKAINLVSGQKLQIRADAVGLHFLCSGVDE
ncbi:hypothetical protein [Mariprofundus ferrooxydans]|uniref:Uncharacterized protein n=1 Tax=Mariprofundus ferrooxydans PV-1 TaxID=314345 RepID=Q0F1T1_9PROT|nr:hypothetical protein [Mariprofundus ferrooxydans]EAU55819.1 hypothetical protein SPV1_02687 [Mariprofundus ferrooxydans PV-1]KON47032.1 hypothetical protein AL013_10615 [Mariprofundus ferrooxydans]